MKAYLNRRYHFSASHRLHAESLTSEQNRLTYGKCNNPYGHGHNYTITVTFSGTVSLVTGMVTNLADLDAFAAQHLLSIFNETNLNTIYPFAAVVPSTENLTLELHRIFQTYPDAQLENIHIEETSNNSFDYRTPPQP